MSVIRITLTKLKEIENPKHPNNIPEGDVKPGFLINPPTIGKRFYLTMSYSTSPVTKIIDENTFETLNSTYKIDIVDDNLPL